MPKGTLQFHFLKCQQKVINYMLAHHPLKKKNQNQIAQRWFVENLVSKLFQ